MCVYVTKFCVEIMSETFKWNVLKFCGFIAVINSKNLTQGFPNKSTKKIFVLLWKNIFKICLRDSVVNSIIYNSCVLTK